MGIQLVLRHVVHHLLLLLLLLLTMITVRLYLALLVRVHVLCLLSPVALLLVLLQVLPWLMSLWGSHKVGSLVPRMSSTCMQDR